MVGGEVEVVVPQMRTEGEFASFCALSSLQSQDVTSMWIFCEIAEFPPGLIPREDNHKSVRHLSLMRRCDDLDEPTTQRKRFDQPSVH